MTGKRTRIRVLPASWPLGRSENLPGRLRIIAPQMIMAPWELGTSDETYAFPGGVVGDEQDPNSGAVERLAFFPTFRIDRDSFSLLLSRLGVQTVDKTFAAFGCRARHKSYAHSLVTYLVQMRFVTQAALKEVFGIGPSSEDKRITEQSVDIGEAMWSFVQREKKRVEPGLGLVPDDVALDLGYRPPFVFTYGIPDVSEELAFGILVENRRFGIYRILEPTRNAHQVSSSRKRDLPTSPRRLEELLHGSDSREWHSLLGRDVRRSSSARISAACSASG